MFQINIKAIGHYFHPFKSVYASIVIISCIAQYKIAGGKTSTDHLKKAM
jgi:hypothetical protein